MGACSKNSENEHLPEYCQTYAGFSATASRDLFELLSDSGDDINRFNYLSIISKIELDFEVDDPNREIDLGGIQCFQNLTSLTLSGHSFKDISEISALSNIQSIQLLGTSVVSIDSFKNLSKINSLVISDTKTLQSVDGVGEMTKLTDLDLSNNGLVNIGELNNLVNLKHLYLNNNEIVYFPSINQLRYLETLDISHNNIIQLGEDLSGLSNLTHLNASYNRIQDLSTLDDLNSLEELDLSYNNLGAVGIGISPNFDSLENAPNLSILKLNNNNLTSIEGLRDRTINLEELHLENNQLTDITPISEYTGIETLVLYNNNIVNISGLSGMTSLSSIDLSFNNILNMDDLRLIPNLQYVDLNHNNISIIPDISTSWDELLSLNLSSNALTDTSGVEGHPTLQNLYLFDNGLTEIEGISNLPQLRTLIIDTPLVPFIHEDLGEITYTNPNLIRVIRNCFNDTPRLALIDEDHFLDFGFTLGNSVEIYDSITGNIGIVVIDFGGMNISVINEHSIQLPNLSDLYINDNNLTDIRFILGNPNLTNLYMSNNLITNLTVISGLATDDLDELTVVEARNINANNDLVDAFIDLPSLEEVDLTNTSITSLTNCFNDLENLMTIDIGSENMESIVNSFNNVYTNYAPNNYFEFISGHIGEIRNSFNNGEYNHITIVEQVPFIGATIIEDSFNDITVHSNQGIVINNNDFLEIDGSFNNMTSDTLDLSNNQTQSVVDSFGFSEYSLLDLNTNQLESIPSLGSIGLVETLDLSNNRLTTVSFIDAISGLSTLDISNQKDGLSSYTLPGIDGINNMLTLTELFYDEIGITFIDGLQNTGLDTFALSRSDNGNVLIDSIGSSAFSGSPITYLDLDNHELSDLQFLSNLTAIENLYIGIDVSDLSAFSGIPAESTLDVLAIVNVQLITDFSFLSDYDVLTSLSVPSNLLEITNLDGLDALSALSVNQEDILAINNSFNTLPSFEPTQNYLDSYTNLASISNSFDLFGDPNNVVDEIIISGTFTITNSFNQVSSVRIMDNAAQTVVTFDSASFDEMVTLELEFANYASYAFLDGYISLESVLIETLTDQITNLSNDQITTFTVDTGSSSVSVLTINIADNGVVDYTSITNNPVTITSTAQTLNLSLNNANVTIDSTATNLQLNGTMNNVVVNGINADTITLDTYQSGNTTLNTPVLTDVSRITTTELNANTFTVNTNETAVNIAVRAVTVIINDDQATNYVLDIETGNVIINNSEPDLIIDYIGQDLQVNYNTLESLQISGNFDSLNSVSSVLQNVDLANTGITDLVLSSDQTIMDITSLQAENVTITNNNITSLTADVGNASMTLNTTNNLALNLDLNIDGITLDGGLVPSIDISDTSVISTLDLSGANAVSSIDFGNASVSEIELETNATSISISGTTSSVIDVSGISIDTIDIDTPNSTVSIIDVGVTVNATLIANTIDLSSISFTTLNLNSSSNIGTLNIPLSPSFESLQSNDATIQLLDIETGDTTLTVDAINALNTTLSGDSITSLVVNFGTHNASIITGTSSLTINATANTINLTSDTDSILFDDASVVTTFITSSPNLGDVSSGNATITNITISETASAFDISGTNLSAIDITGDISTFSAVVGTIPTVLLNTSSSNPVTIDVSSTSFEVTAQSDITVAGANLEDFTFDVGTNDVDVTMDQASLDAVLSGTAGLFTVDGIDISTITLSSGSTIETLEFTNLNVNAIDTTGSTVDAINIITTQPNFSITAPNATDISIVGVLLSTFTINNTNLSGTLELSTLQSTLVINGQVQTAIITNDNATSINMDDFTVADVTIQANSLTSLNTGFSSTTTLDLTSLFNNFDLTTNAQTISYTSGTSNTLLYTGGFTGNISVDTNVDKIDFTAINSDITLISDQLNNVTGAVNTINITSADIGTLTIDLDATDITLSSNNPTTILVDGLHTINELLINSTSVTNINTNTVALSQLSLNVGNNNMSITTVSSIIDVNSTSSSNLTLLYTGTSALELSATGLGNAFVTVQNASDVSLQGDMENMVFVGDLVDTLSTNNLSVTTKYTMNNTLLDNLTFASSTLLSSLSQLEMNTLSNTNIEDIVNALTGTSITLFSPITDIDIYNFYYNVEFDSLTAQEEIDQVRYNAIRTTAINDSWLLIVANEYMDYLDETATKTAIDNDTLLTAEQYFQDYLTNELISEEDFGVPASTLARAAIQDTLDQVVLVMDEPTMENEVLLGIEADANTNALTEQTNTTFTIG